MGSRSTKTRQTAVLLALTQLPLLCHADAGESAARSAWGEHRAGSWPESAELAIEAAALGRPWISYGDGRFLEVGYPEIPDPGQPVSLTSTDLDEDGVRDLVVGYRTSAGGRLGLLRGNIDALYPAAKGAVERKQRGELSRAPFLSPGRIVDIAVSPDFVGTGHFDADGHLDLVVAAAGGRALHWLLGSGDGDLSSAGVTPLGGRVTAMLVDDVNRRDGIADVMVTITGRSGSALVVYEGPRGAMGASPEQIALPAAATGIASGYLNDQYARDLVAVTGDSLTLVYGRDRKLSLSSRVRANVESARTHQVALGSRAHSVAVGDFRWEEGHRAEIAVLGEDGSVRVYERDSREPGETTGPPADVWSAGWSHETSSLDPEEIGPLLVPARISSLAAEGLVLLDRAGSRLHLLTTDTRGSSEAELARDGELQTLGRPVVLDLPAMPIAVMPGRFGIEASSDLVLLVEGRPSPILLESVANASIVVNDLGSASDCRPDDGVCAVGPLVDDVCLGPCTLQAAIEHSRQAPGLDSITFAVSGATSASGVVSGPVVIDGAPGSPPNPDIEVTGELIFTGGSSTLRGLAAHSVGGPTAMAFRLSSDNNIVEGCYLGTDTTGTSERGSGAGIWISNATGNLIGGTADPARNILAAAGGSVFVVGSANTVIGNYLGTDPTGTVAVSALSERVGVQLFETVNNVVGGPPPLLRGNLVSGNRGGITVGNGIVQSAGQLVQSNLVGTDVSGALPLGNRMNGVIGAKAGPSTVGGTMENLRNVISGNQLHGVLLQANQDTQVQGNYIGMAANGIDPVANEGHGVHAFAGTVFNNTIGGAVAGAGNLISGNLQAGISFHRCPAACGDASFNTIQGNLIGTDKTGLVAVANGGAGMDLRGTHFQIGGESPEERNLVSGNLLDGILLDETSESVVEGNWIGIDATGDEALGNGGNGLWVLVGGLNTIGGAAGNVMSGNLVGGIDLTASGPNVVQGNMIGTDAGGTGDLGNGDGIVIFNSPGNQIGGTAAGEANIVANNGVGVLIVASAGDKIVSNSIFDNVNGGILAIGSQAEIRENSIFDNGGLGIDFGANGVTPNDPDESDGVQNFPTVLLADSGSGEVRGLLDSTPSASFTVELFSSAVQDPSGHGEGEVFLGSGNVATDASGRAAFSFDLSGFSGFLSATATGTGGGTSEFSGESCGSEFLGASCGVVFLPDPLSSALATYGDEGFVDGGDADTVELLAELEPVELRGVNPVAGFFGLVGPWAECEDWEAPAGTCAEQTSPAFNFSREADEFEGVNAYYHIDTFMRYVNHTLGVAASPTQYEGGVRYDPHGFGGADNSGYFPDTGRLSFGEGNVDDAEDADVVIHELGHGLYDWLTDGGFSEFEGLTEGTGDYFAASYSRRFNQWQPGDPQYDWVFSWDGHNPFFAGRVTDWNDSHTYPDDLTGDPHVDGQFWSSCNVDILEQIGIENTDRAVLVGLGMTSPLSNQQDAAQAVLVAATNLGYPQATRLTMASIYTSCGYGIVLPDDLIFADGFESGDTSAWSLTVP